MTEAKKAKFTLVLPDGSSPLKAPREVFIEQSTQSNQADLNELARAEAVRREADEFMKEHLIQSLRGKIGGF
ncbi:hypothetical protein OP500_03200 [Kingella sp. SNUBH-2017]|jgi:hypothetical protein|uniref:Phage protein n=1 Tax=Kingella pumchi TaxID=2779506 RepID=A0ABS9NMT3_9NEIS|nr:MULTISPECIES: hypothetical protein [Kingella]MCG6504104.1 hypothetical protein [Kingella pumchi]MDD2182329.1 hypothetical protein [Kingella sp. SNUBH-2017]